jgi:hypothetical protein
MKRLSLVALVFFCLVGVVWAAAPNPVPPKLTGGSWRGTVRVYDLTAGTTSTVPIKVAVTEQAAGLLTADVTLGALTIAGAHGVIDGNSFTINASSASGSIYFSGSLGWYPTPRLMVSYISSGGKTYGDSILTPNANP